MLKPLDIQGKIAYNIYRVNQENRETGEKMITAQGIQNLREETFGTLAEYTESFYYYLETELSQENQDALKPLIAQAHEKGISTMQLVEIVKSSIS